ncbi:MAG TPA: SCO family protein [Dokdonella sp.]|uniref:SCO family protein n=1 Tax=Dokdonella sp. TaxID=2291710 RepID=UPI002D7FE1AA|nr:SCO family protein [Dokdonella sp.]HET9033392.1 SCO family protein [Dokdonella sp.]
MKLTASRIILLVSLVLLAAIATLFVARHSSAPDWASATPEVQAILWPGARDVADFKLLEQDGQAFGKSELKGHWNLLYFGYLQCPDICPTTLQSLSRMRKLMVEAGQTADIPQMIFVSVDPENDTAERITGYLAFFDKNLIGLTGEPDQLARLADSLGIIYAEHIDPNGVRSMEHTTSVIVVDPEGRGVAALTGAHQPRVMLGQFNALRKFLAN